MTGSLHRMGLFVLAALAAVGCTPIRSASKSPLSPPRMSSDSVVLDIFFVRFPLGREDVNGPLWDEIDEQQLAPELRRRLMENGFRVGVVGNRLPSRLCALLELQDKPAPCAEQGETVVTDLESEPRVVQRHLQLRANQRSEIVASDVYEQLPVLTCESGSVCGQTYPKAQGILVAKSFPQRDGRVRLELLPELHYGEIRQRYVGTHGALRLETGRSRRAFDDLAISATLTPGGMIVVSCVPGRTGSLGHHFFTHQSAGKSEQKLMVIRLSQTQHDDLFNPEEPLPLDLKGDPPKGPLTF